MLITVCIGKTQGGGYLCQALYLCFNCVFRCIHGVPLYIIIDTYLFQSALERTLNHSRQFLPKKEAYNLKPLSLKHNRVNLGERHLTYQCTQRNLNRHKDNTQTHMQTLSAFYKTDAALL